MSLGIKIGTKDEGIYMVKLSGSLDTETYLELEDELKKVIDENTKAINLDMDEITYISSAGIRSVLWARRVLTAQKAAFTMTNLQPQIHKVFEAMKILSVVNIFSDLEEADKYIDQIIKDELAKQGQKKADDSE